MSFYLIAGFSWLIIIIWSSIVLGRYLDNRELEYMGKTKSKVKKKKRRLLAAAIANGTEKRHGQKKEK